MTPYAALCDDFCLSMYLNTEMPLPQGREAVLHFFDTIKRAYPQMNNFSGREEGEFTLEEDKESGNYRWASLEAKRISSGYVNPSSIAETDKQHLHMLEVAPYHFDINGLDVDALDVVYSFDFVHAGNHDEAVAEALGLRNSLETLLDVPGTRVLKYEPSLMMSLDESMKLQCRLHVETRTSPHQVKADQYGEEPISVYFTVRQYWQGEGIEKLAEAYQNQRKICQQMVDGHIVPSIIQPLLQVIGNS